MGELGLCSRREADRWIENGWVKVDGQIVATLGARVSPEARIEVAPAARERQSEQVTILLHKPVGYVSGQAEDGHEPAVVLIVPANRWTGDPSPLQFRSDHLRGLAPAGRLDIDSTGLLVLTQDGRVAKQLIGENSSVEEGVSGAGRGPAHGRGAAAAAARDAARWCDAAARAGVVAERRPVALRAARGPQAADSAGCASWSGSMSPDSSGCAAATCCWVGCRWANGAICDPMKDSEPGRKADKLRAPCPPKNRRRPRRPRTSSVTSSRPIWPRGSMALAAGPAARGCPAAGGRERGPGAHPHAFSAGAERLPAHRPREIDPA